MNIPTISEGMINTNNAAFNAEMKGHRFGLSDIHSDNRTGVNSPKLSKAGQYYLDCIHCKRTIFEDGSGSASISSCG